jgi:hypothetical protein
MVRRIWVTGLFIALSASLAGCIAVGGSSPQPTKGQELIDLKAALDRGSITPAEYDSTKAQILARH